VIRLLLQPLNEFRLASHLAEITKEKKYLDTAISAAQFLRLQLLSSDSGLVYDSIDGGSCNLNPAQISKSTGLAAQAWIMLADLTNDTQWRDL
jgi:hypothetical protein